MKFKFQVICMNKSFIQEYNNFNWDDLDKMIKYIEYKSTDENINKIEITRWNDKGEIG